MLTWFVNVGIGRSTDTNNQRLTLVSITSWAHYKKTEVNSQVVTLSHRRKTLVFFHKTCEG